MIFIKVFNLVKNNKVLRYIFSGGSAFVCHITILYIFVHYLNVWYLTSTIFAFCFAVMVNYFLQKFFTFNNYSNKKIHLQFSYFVFSSLFMLGLNTLFMYVFVDIMELWYIFAQIIINIFTAFLSYIIYNKIIFKDKSIIK